MLSLNRVYPDRLVLRIQVMLYLLLAALLSLLMVFQYANGQYTQVLAEMLLVPGLLMGAAYLLIRRETTGQDLVHTSLIALLALVFLYTLRDAPQLNFYLLLIVPVVAALVLPLRFAVALTAIVTFLLLVVLLMRLDLLISLRSKIPTHFSRFERLAEVVTQDQAILTETREHFAFYRERGYPVETHKIA